jgi:hypothetical protein
MLSQGIDVEALARLAALIGGHAFRRKVRGYDGSGGQT